MLPIEILNALICWLRTPLLVLYSTKIKASVCKDGHIWMSNVVLCQ